MLTTTVHPLSYFHFSVAHHFHQLRHNLCIIFKLAPKTFEYQITRQILEKKSIAHRHISYRRSKSHIMQTNQHFPDRFQTLEVREFHTVNHVMPDNNNTAPQNATVPFMRINW